MKKDARTHTCSCETDGEKGGGGVDQREGGGRTYDNLFAPGT